MPERKSYLSEIRKRIAPAKSVHMNKISAVPVSLYSDLSIDSQKIWNLTIRKDVRNNPDKLCKLLVVLALNKPFWYDEFILYCSEQSKRYKYEKKWMLLHKLTKVYHFDLIIYCIDERISGNEFFGNWLPEIIKFSQDCPAKFLHQWKPKPREIQRKRGYNDKGSRKLEHEKHDFTERPSGLNPEKLDLSSCHRKKNHLVNFLYG